MNSAQQAGAVGRDDMAVVVVTVAGHRCALPTVAVREILPAARLEPLAGAPDKVLGVLNLRSEPVVVVDSGTCLGSEATPLAPRDRFVVLAGTEPATALRVHAAHDVATIGADDLRAGLALGGQELASAGLAVLPDGLLVIHDPATFVTATDVEAFRGLVEQRGPA